MGTIRIKPLTVADLKDQGACQRGIAVFRRVFKGSAMPPVLTPREARALVKAASRVTALVFPVDEVWRYVTRRSSITLHAPDWLKWKARSDDAFDQLCRANGWHPLTAKQRRAYTRRMAFSLLRLIYRWGNEEET